MIKKSISENYNECKPSDPVDSDPGIRKVIDQSKYCINESTDKGSICYCCTKLRFLNHVEKTKPRGPYGLGVALTYQVSLPFIPNVA
jgi:hypothetical protein